MFSPAHRRFVWRFLVLGLVLAAPARGWAQEEAADPAEKVRFSTVDGVTLHGSYYKGPRAAPAVLMLHPLGSGENRNKKNWVDLAKALQKNFSVLTFDFRGHGESVDVDGPLFTYYPPNQQAVKDPKPNRTRLEFKELSPASYILLCNDIAAAKSYLERTKNDLGSCNTQSFTLVGAEQGATLGAIWAKSEYYRYRFEVNTALLAPMPRFETRPEGKYFSAFVWLSISPKLGNSPVSLPNLLDIPCKQSHTPAVFLYNESDPKNAKVSKDLEKYIKFGASKKPDPRLAMTGAFGLKAGEKLSGVDLLQESLKTTPMVTEWLKQAAQNNNEWSQREFMKSLYAWRVGNSVIPARPIPAIYTGLLPAGPYAFPPNAPLPAEVEKNISYDTYQRFVLAR